MNDTQIAMVSLSAMKTQAQQAKSIELRQQVAVAEKMLADALASFGNEDALQMALRKVLKQMRLKDGTYELIGNGVGRVPQELARGNLI